MSLVERARTVNTLACLLSGLQGRTTTVELRNECSVHGRINSVDCLMNTHMSNVTFTTLFGKVTKFDSFYVPGKNIRYVHIPQNVNIMRTVQTEIDRQLGKSKHTERKPKKLNSWHQKLAKQRQKKVLEEKKVATAGKKDDSSIDQKCVKS